ncbi:MULTISPECIES: halorhodopsin [Halobacterium]|uniref:Halorhodopsin n=5 Tax=Halobacterium salinarum TaxID=2242 RepID=BACH_HALSA|nr:MULTISPECIES: halorhodopsin [Halobacterium]B0R2U4.1 RecName: Full=Halorhodopsin; Short=HR; Flags: Precursor [Halobacterium salinarum R1]P0DMH7.1 RecName: Full=Halorhodopsin; Short=HR; Flags: Precursor [Halobacterium salinarum NRC-1]CAB37866.1 halorhodopsin [Halobacterium sp.]AAG18795.1 halorhodopsin [Halobacterium salinarum NRC-1]MBB6090784.1 halorhodopsin [Halobacterium salinarum]MCF2166103.1 bacteriorhodopsin [Halobacterium salinarum]MCF2166803.1 bacteriorhodopsin [Halobacterium salinar
MSITSVPGVVDAGVLGAQSAAAVRENALLSSSLWVNVALAGIAILVFVYMGRTIRPGRPRLIWGATLMIPLVSISSYLGLLSGLTVGMIEMPAGHALAGEMVRSQWGRYLTWALSTPMILLALGLLADVDLGSLFTVIAADIGMCVTGLAAAMTTSALLFRWAFYAISCAFFVVVLSALVTDWAASASSAGTAEIFDTLRVLTVVLWLGYPIVWAVGVEGLALVQSVGVTSWAYSVLDVFAKYVFAFILLRWVANNERTVAVAGQTLGTMSSDD